ncbi:MAG: hypothetical protein J4G05_08345 [Chlorobi bacterium]|nr:hypothetical protein [Chlorobiota bacterium]
MLVSRCICYDQPFEQSIEIARNEGCKTVLELQDYITISKRCGLCIPYVQRAIETGEEVIPRMSQEEAARWRKRSGIEGGESSA